MDVGYHNNYLGLYEGQTVFLPVVDAVLREAVQTESRSSIEAFIGFHITKVSSARKNISELFCRKRISGRGPGGPITAHGFAVLVVLSADKTMKSKTLCLAGIFTVSQSEMMLICAGKEK
jgi:hypothetical protein